MKHCKSYLAVLTIFLLFAVLTLSGCGKKKLESEVHAITPTTTVPSADPNTESEEQFPKVGYVTAQDGLWVRSGPGTQYDMLDSLKNGESLIVIARQGDWFKIERPELDREEIYVNAQYVSFSPPGQDDQPNDNQNNNDTPENPPAEDTPGSIENHD